MKLMPPACLLPLNSSSAAFPAGHTQICSSDLSLLSSALQHVLLLLDTWCLNPLHNVSLKRFDSFFALSLCSSPAWHKSQNHWMGKAGRNHCGSSTVFQGGLESCKKELSIALQTWLLQEAMSRKFILHSYSCFCGFRLCYLNFSLHKSGWKKFHPESFDIITS